MKIRVNGLHDNAFVCLLPFAKFIFNHRTEHYRQHVAAREETAHTSFLEAEQEYWEDAFDVEKNETVGSNAEWRALFEILLMKVLKAKYMGADWACAEKELVDWREAMSLMARRLVVRFSF